MTIPSTHTAYLKLAGLLLVSFFLFLSYAESARAQYITSGPPSAPTCLNGTAGTSYQFSYIGSTNPDCAPQGSDGGSCTVSGTVTIDFGDVSYSGDGFVQGSHTWATTGTYWAYGVGPAWSTSSCQGANGSPGGGCSATGGPGSGILTGPDGSASGGPAFCKVVITEAPTEPVLSDLTAGVVTPTTVTAGVTVALNSTVANIGAAWTNSNFVTIYQRASNSSGAGAFFITSDNSPAMGPNSSIAASAPYKFPSAGAYYVRACADIGDVVNESNENNNCGPWTTIVANDPLLSASCTVSPTSITAGQSATWTAAATGGNGSYTYSWTGTDSLTGTAASVSKTYSTAGTKTASVTVNSGGQSVTANCTNSLTVAANPKPDLTAGAITPTVAVAGTNVTLSSNIANQGTASTGAGFTTLFQRATSSSGSGATDIGTHTRSSAMAAGASSSAGRTYAFPSAGTWYVRACADKSSASNPGTISESNESNNCGPWTAISVSSATPTSLSCSVTDTSVSVGESVTYTASGASAPYTWTASGGGSYGTGSTATRTFSSTGSYTMTVSKSGYTSGTCPAVNVGALACTNPSVSISASPDRVREGQSVTVSWSASGIDSSCTITGPGVHETITAASCSIPNGSATPTITEQSVYRISCDSGEATDEVIVNLVPGFLEF